MGTLQIKMHHHASMLQSYLMSSAIDWLAIIDVVGAILK
jgi:hypothetical protein